MLLGEEEKNTMTNMPDRPLTTEEWEAVRKTLDILQEAQYLTEHASQALCPVPGFAEEWSELAIAWEAVKKSWHLVEARRIQIGQHEKPNTVSARPSQTPTSAHMPLRG